MRRRLQDSPCPTPRETRSLDGMFDGFSYVAPSFLAEAAAGDTGADTSLHHMDPIPE